MITGEQKQQFLANLRSANVQWEWTIVDDYDYFNRSVLRLCRDENFEVRIESPLDSNDWTFFILEFRG